MLRVLRTSARAASASPAQREPRRTVDFKAFGILPERETFSFSVLDLSYNGCRIRSDLALLPGTQLKISIQGLGGATGAVVRWYRNGFAGLEFEPEDETDTTQTPRICERVSLDAQLMLRRFGRQCYVARLFDLTPRGCRVEFIERPKTDERIWVKLDTLESIEARVKWVDGFYGGLAFVRPIYPAVFDILLAKLKHVSS